MAATIDEEKFKDWVKSALVEALEDIALVRAIEGLRSESISLDEVFATLKREQ